MKFVVDVLVQKLSNSLSNMFGANLICEFELPIDITPSMRIIDGPKIHLLRDYFNIKHDIQQRLIKVWKTEIDKDLKVSIQSHYKSMKKISCSCLILNALIFSIFLTFIETILSDEDVIIQYGMYSFAISWIIEGVILSCYIFRKIAQLIDKKVQWHDQFIFKMNEYVHQTLKIDYQFWTFSTTASQHYFYIRIIDATSPILAPRIHSDSHSIDSRSLHGSYTPLLDSISEAGPIN